MLLPQVLCAVLKRLISEIDRKYAENMRYPRPRLGRPNSFSGQSLGMNFVAKPMVGRIWRLCDRPFPALNYVIETKRFATRHLY